MRSAHRAYESLFRFCFAKKFRLEIVDYHSRVWYNYAESTSESEERSYDITKKAR